MSQSSEVSVVLPAALHARPAGEVVRAAARYRATIEVWHEGRAASARSALRLMSLGAGAGAAVTVHASGEDSVGAAAAVAAVLREAS